MRLNQLKCRVRSCQRAHPIGGKRRSHATCGLRLRRDVLQLEHEAAELLRPQRLPFDHSCAVKEKSTRRSGTDEDCH